MSHHSNKLNKPTAYGFATRNIHSGSIPDPTTGSILTPIYQTATYVQDAIGINKGYTYSRTSNPTVSALEKKIGELEGIENAHGFTTGMAATSTLLLALLKKGDDILCSDVVYGGTVRLLQHILHKFGVTHQFVDTSSLSAVKKSLKPNTRLIFIETPANPTLKLADIASLANIAHENNIPLIVDNTFLTSALQKPFDFNTDIVLYSTTKYIDGHNATIGGALLAKDPNYNEQFGFIRNTLGSIQSPFDAWLTLQGIKTLDLRMKQHSANALTVADFLQSHKKVRRVTYPGLKTFAQYELAQTQQLGNGGMLTFELVGGYHHAIKLMNSVKLCSLAESLGSVETLITHPVSMTHGQIPKEIRERIGIEDGLIRLSVGLENPIDIITDLDAALFQCED